MLRFYQDALRGGDLRYTIFGHIGDNHVHVNILPRSDDEAAKAWAIYHQFIRRAVEGEITNQVAASYLQQHPNARIVLDTAAAAELTRFKTPWLLSNLYPTALSPA